MYVTPHDWTLFGRNARSRPVVQFDQRKWDYRHQVLAQKYLRPWQLFVLVKWLELRFHLRPRRIWSIVRERDRLRRHQRMWVCRHIALVWLAEVFEFLFRTTFTRKPVTLAEVVDHPRPARRPVYTRGPA
jgi:anaerobic magnesium-protoporphyrin IX monomethyl ester cyclase